MNTFFSDSASNTAQFMELVRVNEMISKTKLEIAKEEEEHRLAAKGNIDDCWAYLEG